MKIIWRPILMGMVSLNIANAEVEKFEPKPIYISTEACYKIIKEDLVIYGTSAELEELEALPVDKIDKSSQMRPVGMYRFRETDGKIVLLETMVMFLENGTTNQFWAHENFKHDESTFLAPGTSVQGFDWVSFKGMTLSSPVRHLVEVINHKKVVTKYFCPGIRPQEDAELKDIKVRNDGFLYKISTAQEFREWGIKNTEEFIKAKPTSALEGLAKDFLESAGVGIILPWTIPGLIENIATKFFQRANADIDRILFGDKK